MEPIPTRPVFRHDLLDGVGSAYGFRWSGAPVDVGGGSSLNVAVDDVVIRVHRRWLREPRLEAMQAVRTDLRSLGLPTIEPLRTLAGARWIRWQSHLVEVERRAEGSFMTSWPELLHGMAVLGRLHAGLAAVTVPAAARTAAATNQITIEEAVPLAAEVTVIATTTWPDVTADERRVAEATERHARRIAERWAPFAGRLPRQLVHGDFWDNNILFVDDDVVAILDFDFMTERDRIDDLALILYYVRSGDTLPSDRERLRALVDAYDRTAVPKLSALEREALPLALARVLLKSTRHLLQRTSPSEQRLVLEAERPELEWSVEIVDRLADWQRAFA